MGYKVLIRLIIPSTDTMEMALVELKVPFG